MEKFSDCPRIDLECFDKAIERGWTADFDWRDKTYGRTTPENCPHFPVSYRKGNVVAWKCITFNTGIQYIKVADLIDGSYRNHRDYDDFNQVLENETNFN